jgi:hypothetical protein
VNAYKKLKNPSSSWCFSRKTFLIRDCDFTFLQRLSQAMFQRAVNQKTSGHHKRKGSNTFRLSHKKRRCHNIGVFNESKAAFDTMLFFIGF